METIFLTKIKSTGTCYLSHNKLDFQNVPCVMLTSRRSDTVTELMCEQRSFLLLWYLALSRLIFPVIKKIYIYIYTNFSQLFWFFTANAANAESQSNWIRRINVRNKRNGRHAHVCRASNGTQWACCVLSTLRCLTFNEICSRPL